MEFLTSYYKYHFEVSRIFMKPIVTNLNHYHDQKRKIHFKEIMKLIGEEEENKTNNNEFVKV